MDKNENRWSIVWSGKTTMARFQKVCRSITRTSTRQTTALKISNLSPRLNTSGCMKAANLLMVYGTNRAKYAASSNHATRNIGITDMAGLKAESAKNAPSRKFAKTEKQELQRDGNAKTTQERKVQIDGMTETQTKLFEE